MKYKEIDSDVTKMLPEYVIAHCISNDCAMGSGVVIAIRNVFPGLKAACINYINAAKNNRGNHFINERGVFVTYRHSAPNGVVYNMFTKERYWDKAGIGIDYKTYLGNLRDSLEFVKSMILQHGETKLALPKIGCGRDKCKWEDVKAIIFDVFESTDIELIICNYKER